MSYIISRSDGRIYVGVMHYLRVGPEQALVAFADTDMPKGACQFATEEEAKVWAERLRTLPLLPEHMLGGVILLAPRELRDFVAQPLEGSKQYEGQRLAAPVTVQRAPPPPDEGFPPPLEMNFCPTCGTKFGECEHTKDMG